MASQNIQAAAYRTQFYLEQLRDSIAREHDVNPMTQKAAVRSVETALHQIDLVIRDLEEL